MAATLPLIGLSPAVAVFGAALVLYGLSNGALDLASNAHAAGVERRLKRPLMSGFHAMFSAGAIAGAGGAALLAGLDVPIEVHATVIGSLLVAALVGVAFGLARGRSNPEPMAPPAALALPHGALLGLSALAFCVLLSEGAVFDWSAIYLSSVAGAAPAVAAIGLALFQATMMIGRLFGDRLAERISPQHLVRGGAVAGIGGLGLAILLPTPATTLAGYAVLGGGLAVSFPLAMSAAARLPRISTPIAMGAVTAAGYTGFMAGPPAIGFVAEASNLRVGLSVVLVCLLGAVLLASHLRRPSPGVDDAPISRPGT
jgi:MFS family permease